MRVSSDEAAAFVRTSTTGDTEPSLIVDGASLSGAGIILDSTSKASISSVATLRAQSLSLGSSRILVDFGRTSSDSGTLILSGDLLNNLSTSQKLSLNSYSSLDFAGAGTLGSSALKSLSLNTGGLRGISASVTLEAQNVLLSNLLGSTVDSADSGSTLQIVARNLDLGSGNFKLAGFDTTTITASGGVRTTGSGSINTGGSLAITAPSLAANRLTNYAITAAGALNLNNSGASSPSSSELGAAVSLTGSSVNIKSDIYLPSGLLKIEATSGDLLIGSKLSVEGTSHTYYDTELFANAGSIVLKSDTGNVILNTDGTLSASGATKEGAPVLSKSAPQVVNSETQEP